MNKQFYEECENQIITNDETTYRDMPPLKIGDVGPDVLILQDKLKILGYLFTPENNAFDEETELAVKNFQRDNNIPVTGLVNKPTWKILFAETPSPFSPTPFSLTLPTLKLGSTGPYVSQLQTQLAQLLYFSGSIDGVFGLATEAAVKSFQSVNKLTVDGIVGRATWAALVYLYQPLAICGADETGRVTHIVQSGDTLFSIARRYNTTVEEIMRLNNLTSTALRVGQELLIFEGPEIPTPPDTNVHIVQSGDTLFSIARRYNTTVEELKRLNNLTSDVISVGQRLIVPATVLPTDNFFEYVVIAGDTLFSIARRYNTTVEEIMRLNNLTNTTLSIGQILMIPAPAGVQFVTHTIRAGDTLFSIANRFNSTVDAIRYYNNLTNDIINVGRRLVVPINII